LQSIRNYPEGKCHPMDVAAFWRWLAARAVKQGGPW